MKHVLPLTIGALRGAAMLAMSHDAILVGQSPWALLAFAALHLIIPLVLLSAALLLRKHFPAMAARLVRVHRPSLAHVAVMICGAMASISVIHLFHGGPI